MTVASVDLAAAYGELGEDIDRALQEVAASGRYLFGERLIAFEAAWAEHVGARHCVAVANGLEALELGLRACGVGQGDEVIVPANTYIATWLAVSHCGATPVPVEPDAATYTIDPARVERALTSRTRALLPVHLYGHPADMDSLLAIARDSGIAVVEDAAQAHGARHRTLALGAHGDAVAWSFYPTKNLGALGDAGALTTTRDDVAERLRRLRNYGEDAKYHNAIAGYNSRMDEVQAAVLLLKLAHLERWNERRSAIAARYSTELAGTALTLPWVAPHVVPVWHQYVVRTRDRDGVRQQLRDRGIETQVHYPVPPHLQPAYAQLGIERGALPLTEALAQEVLSLPVHPHLTDDQVGQVIDALGEAAG